MSEQDMMQIVLNEDWKTWFEAELAKRDLHLFKIPLPRGC